MPGWAVQLIVPVGEALAVGLLAFVGAYGTTHNLSAAWAAAVAAAIGKALPSQVVAKK